MSRRIPWVVLALLSSPVICAGVDGIGPDLPDARTGPPFPRIANCYGAGLHARTKTEVLDELAKFDLLIGGVVRGSTPEQKAEVARHAAYLRKKNPGIVILEFSSSAPYAQPWHVTFPGFPEDAWLRTPEGQTINGWPGSKMLNLSKPAVIDWLAARSHAAVRSPVLNGTFIDCMGGAFDRWACEIATGKPYKVDADEDGKPDDRATLDRLWRQAKLALGRKVREGIGPRALFMANQAHENNYPYLNGILLEDDLDYVLDDGRSWDRVLRHYFHWTQTPHRPCVTTIVSSSGIAPPYNAWKTLAEAQREALLARGKALLGRMRFGLATALMGDGYFAYDLHTRWRGQHWWYDEYDAPLGYPTGASRRHGDGTWRRRFDGGLVVVNPTHFDLPVDTKARCRDLSSGRVADAFMLPAQDGRILVPADEPPRPGTLADPDPLFTPDGPQPVVRRGDKVLLRLGDGNAAVFRMDGRMLALFFGGRTLVRNLRPLMTATRRWRDFQYADAAEPQWKDGVLRFAGRRRAGDKTASYRLRVTPKDGSLHFAYEFTAVTALYLHAFRHQAEFPASLYAGGSVRAGERTIDLPAKTPRRGMLAAGMRKMTIRPGGAMVEVRLESTTPFGLQDERVYGVDAFLLAHGAPNGQIASGTRWKLDLTLTPQPRPSD